MEQSPGDVHEGFWRNAPVYVKARKKIEDARLKLWHVELPPINSLGYQSYDSFVVAARTEQDARCTHPRGMDMLENDPGYEWISLDRVQILKVAEIGIASEDITKTTVIVASYNAG